MSHSNQNGLVKSENYDDLKFSADNRTLDLNHVKKLKWEIEKCNDLHLQPIIVNQNLEIVDGQHRFQAAKELGVPYFYLIDENYEPGKMISYNTTQKNWTPIDYLNYWCHHGNHDYKRLKEFTDDLGFNLRSVLIWLTNSGGQSTKDFRTGNFRFNISDNLLEGIYNAKRFIHYCVERRIKPVHMFTAGTLHKAMKLFFTHGLVDSEQFFYKLETCSFLVKPKASWQEYFDLLVEIYNFDQKKNRIKVVSDGNKRDLQE